MKKLLLASRILRLSDTLAEKQLADIRAGGDGANFERKLAKLHALHRKIFAK